MVGRGESGHDKASQSWYGEARLGKVRVGMVGQGEASQPRLVLVGYGPARFGEASQSWYGAFRHGWLVRARRVESVEARHGAEWHGTA